MASKNLADVTLDRTAEPFYIELTDEDGNCVLRPVLPLKAMTERRRAEKESQ